jgi:hypothetical protein
MRMGRLVLRVGLLLQLLCAASALWAAGAAAEPGTGPREVVDQTFTTTRPNSPTGVGFTGRYHAAGDENGNPPAMRRMVFYPPQGMHYDTSVPERCTASDIELQIRGPAACPPGSQLGDGTTEGLIMQPVTGGFVWDHYTHPVYIFNNANEQIVLIESEGFTVVRGRFMPDGSIEWDLPTCFPTVPGVECVDDYLIQLSTSTFLPPYTRTSGDRVRSYATTPPKCPAQRYWETRVEFSWADGSTDSVVTTQPCKRR